MPDELVKIIVPPPEKISGLFFISVLNKQYIHVIIPSPPLIDIEGLNLP